MTANDGIRHINANGIDFAYLEDGPTDGPLALCLHGFPDHAPTFEELLPRLASAGYHAVAPWLRGYAPTSLAPDGNYQVASVTLDTIALADALAGEREAVLIGHDWGAISAYTTVNYAPQRFTKLVTLAVPHPVALASSFFSPDQLKRSFYIFLFQTPLAEMAVANDDFALIDFIWRTWSPGHEPSKQYMRRLKDTLAAPGSTEAAIGYYRATLGTTPPDPSLDAVTAAGGAPIQIPTLYLHGADDGCMGVEMVDEARLREVHPGGLDLEVVPASGHFLHLDQPETVSTRILDFLAR